MQYENADDYVLAGKVVPIRRTNKVCMVALPTQKTFEPVVARHGPARVPFSVHWDAKQRCCLDDALPLLQAFPAPKVVLSTIAALDTSPKVIGFGPDDRLYVTIGPPCSAGMVI